jgi:hypothetical protein
MLPRHVMKSLAGILRAGLTAMLITPIGCDGEESRLKTEARDAGGNDARSESSPASDEGQDGGSVQALDEKTPAAREAPTLEEALGTPDEVESHLRRIPEWSYQSAVVHPQDRSARITMVGWSPDGRYYATVMEIDDVGPTGCAGSIDIQVVDTTEDAWPKDSHVELRDLPGDQGCEYGSWDALRVAAEASLQPLLSRFDIRQDWVMEPLQLVGDEGRYVLTLPDGEQVGLELSLTGSRDPHAAKAGYRLAFDAPVSRVIEAGTRHRSFIFHYELIAVLPSPDGSRAAFVIERIESGFEGDRIFSFMSNGVELPIK